MSSSKIPSLARSQGTPETPRQYKLRGSRSVCSPARSNASLKLSSVVEQFKENKEESFATSSLGKSILSDNTDIDMPRRKSWWKKVDHSRDILEVLDNHHPLATNNVMEEFDVEVLSQEKKNYTLDMPESSDSESISSIVIPQRKLFTQKENQHQKVFGQVFGAGTRETLAPQNKTNLADKTANVGPKNLFNLGPKRSKPVFPAALLNISPDKTVSNKTKEMTADLKAPSRHLFGNRPGTKRKNMFADFIVSESEDDISEVQPKIFAFALNKNPVRHSRSLSRGVREPSPTSSVTATDIEMDDWNMLPSSTMVEQQLEAGMPTSTPGKRSRLSKLSKALESVITNSTAVQEANNREEIEAEVRDNASQEENKTADSNDKAEGDVSQDDCYHESQGQVGKYVNEEYESNELEQNEDENEMIPENKVRDRSLGQPGKDTQLTELSEALVLLEKAKHHEGNEAETQNNIKAYQQEIELADINGEAEGDVAMEGNHEENQEQEIKQDNKEDRYKELKLQINENKEVSQTKSKAIELEDENQGIEEDQNERHEKRNQSKQSNEKHNENAQNEDEKESENEDEEQNKSPVEEESHGDKKEHQNASQDFVEQEYIKEQNENQLIDDSHEKEDGVQNEILEIEEQVDVEELNESQIIDEIHEEDKKVQNENPEIEELKEIEKQNESKIVDEIHEEEEKVQNESNEVEEQVDIEEDENEDIENQEDEESEEIEEEQNESQEVEESSGADDEVRNESQELEEQEAEEHESENEIEQDDVIDDSEEAQIEDALDDLKLVYEDDDELQNDEDAQIDTESETPNVSHATIGKNRKKQNNTESPEAILQNITNEIDTFIAKGRNTSIKKTKSILKNFTIRQSHAPTRDSTGLSDGTKNSSAEGSGWDSHRTTRKTLRQTFGKDFTPRKSLRTLVMEKSAKRQTIIDAANANLHQANSTELPVDESGRQDMQVDEDQIDYEEDAQAIEESAHEVSKRRRQTTLEMYLQKIKKNNMERKLKIEEQVRNSFKTNPLNNIMNFQGPSKLRRPNAKPLKSLETAPKVKRMRSNLISLEDLPPELIEDMKYKPPKRFQPSNASWITNRLYKFLENKLETRYDYKARVRAEALVQVIYNFVRDTRRERIAPSHMVNELKREMARLDIVKTNYDFYNFFHDYLPKEVAVKVIPDILNEIPIPKEGVFSDIIVS